MMEKLVTIKCLDNVERQLKVLVHSESNAYFCETEMEMISAALHETWKYIDKNKKFSGYQNTKFKGRGYYEFMHEKNEDGKYECGYFSEADFDAMTIAQMYASLHMDREPVVRCDFKTGEVTHFGIVGDGSPKRETISSMLRRLHELSEIEVNLCNGENEDPCAIFSYQPMKDKANLFPFLCMPHIHRLFSTKSLMPSRKTLDLPVLREGENPIQAYINRLEKQLGLSAVINPMESSRVESTTNIREYKVYRR